ncbi:MAG: ring-cleaving dioxygenase [Salinarimonas sp.]|nr:ring-cleaving dioxygenase [Salinarimonas sp.]
MSVAGIHHVTAMAGAPWRNRHFHAEILGQRLVKRTVNFDDPATWHLYYGDGEGRPGSALTFFPWPHIAPGRPGDGETVETAFRAPAAALDFWRERLEAHGVAVQAEERHGRGALTFRDPDGMALAIIGVAGAQDEPAWIVPGIDASAALRGFESVTLAVPDPDITGAILRDVLGFRHSEARPGHLGLAGSDSPLTAVEIVESTHGTRPRLGAGSVHHVAFRAADDAAQEAMAETLRSRFGIEATEQRDRNYFRSIYFREPGGVLFEIATDGPGFAVDEDPAHLGETLQLPAGLEARRETIAARLPSLEPEEA